MEVYQLTASQHFRKRLYFIGKASQAGEGPIGQGPGGPVITVDMPEILHRLGFPATARTSWNTSSLLRFAPYGRIVRIDADRSRS